MKEKKGSFLSEFAQSWVGQLSLVLLIALTVLIVMLQLEWFPFHNLSVFLSEDKYGYTFKMIEITVSILAFSALVWSISYQRDELLQSRHELKVQSEDVNRSIDEANKNFDRELLLEFYRKITEEIQGIDFNTSSFLVGSQYRICRYHDKKIVKEIQDCIGKADFTTLELRALLTKIDAKANSIDTDDSDPRDLLQYAYRDPHIMSAIKTVEENLSKVEFSVLILLYDMIYYAKTKDISFKEPVFSLLKSTLRTNSFFEEKHDGYRLGLTGIRDALTNVGVIKESENPYVFIGEKEFEQFLSALCELNAVKNINDFRDYILGIGESM